MAKAKSQYVCADCGHVAVRWLGKCPSCEAYGTFQEEQLQTTTPASDSPRHQAWAGTTSSPTPLSQVKEDTYVRTPSHMAEFDHVLGGGLVDRSVILIGGDPGIGKSTLLLQVLAEYSKTKKVMYCTGEESEGQIKMRATRLGCDNADITLLSEVNLEAIFEHCKRFKPEILVIDSIQTMYSSLLQSAPGSVGQVKECAAQLNRMAKSQGVTLFLIGHVTKDGNLAGPRVLEHIVDTVLYFEGTSGMSFRMLRAIKNRFGAAHEIAVFAMTEKGLSEVNNPSAMFMSEHDKPVIGSAITSVVEGSRPLLVEVQALVEPSITTNPKRYAEGVDVSRVQMLLATLSKYLQVQSSDNNVYINVVGGVRIQEPAADLSIAVAAVSSLQNKAVPKGWCFIGEVGLTGEIRPVAYLDMRIKEAIKLGFTHIVVPFSGEMKHHPNIEIHRVKRLDEAISIYKNA